MVSPIDVYGTARHALTLTHWKWLPGMVTTGGIVVSVKPEVITIYDRGLLRLLGETELPDLHNPATEGHLLQLVRDAWGADDACIYRVFGDRWEVDGIDFAGVFYYRWEALVAALEAAP